MSVLTFDEGQLADLAGVDHFLHLNKAGVVAGNLADHQHDAGLLLDTQHLLALLSSQSHRLLQQDGLAVTQEGAGLLHVAVVGGDDDGSIHIGIAQQLLVIQAELFCTVLFCLLLCTTVGGVVADCVQMAIFVTAEALKVIVRDLTGTDQGDIQLLFAHNTCSFQKIVL